MKAMAWALKECVWEITLACNQKCLHCGSAAGKARPRELSTCEAMGLVGELARLGCEGVTLSGGEPLLREDWREIAGEIRRRGMKSSLITNGLLVEQYAEEIAEAGFRSLSFSVDGVPPVHDRIRAAHGAMDRLLAGAKALMDRDVVFGAVTHINRLNWDHLDALHDLLVEKGFSGWQVQLTMPHGRAAELMNGLVLTPEELPVLEKKLLSIRHRTPLFFQAADNIGYMGKGEPALRAGTPRADKFFGGCQAGLSVVGITADGSVRGCLSMTDAMNDGNIRVRPLAEIWGDANAFSYNRRFRMEDLTGSCVGCAYGKICRGGCKSLALATTGDIHTNRHCIHAVSR